MQFDNSQVVEGICQMLRMADYTRSKNRALIDNLYNGLPPYSSPEMEDNPGGINVNFLETTKVAHDARSQFNQSILKPGNFFNATTDWGSVDKRQKYSTIVTKEMNRIMKNDMVYIESQRSKIAMNVLHGIAPAGWRDKEKWCPYAMGIADVYVPGGTLLTMENLPFFAIYTTYTAPQMIKLTQAGNLDPAWNRPMLNACIKWVDKESQSLMYNRWPEVWAPEKTAERLKSNGGFYWGDEVPTINVFDFYFWNDSAKVSGWNRRMILDAWSFPDEAAGASTSKPSPVRRTGSIFEDSKRKFLYNPGNRKEAMDRSEIVNWQFADLSAIAPFRYHSVRSLGFLLYAIGNLQNRLRCKISEAVFEQLMMYFRVSGDDDLQRALKVDLVNRGFIDDSIKFIPPQDRYQVNQALAQMGMNMNAQLIASNSSSWTAQPQTQGDQKEKTKYQYMAEVSAMNTLVSSALSQAYMYQKPEYKEIFRRFTIKGSRDADVRRYQDRCLSQGVSEKVLYNPECWEQEPQRVIGAGNKSMEMAIAEQLMQVRNLYDPEAQRGILREFTLAVTDDAAKADSWVPETPAKVTDSVHDAQLAAGTLMQGLPVAIKSGMNHIEYVDTLMATLMQMIQQVSQSGLPTPDKLSGMFNMLNHIQQHIQIIAQDPAEKQRVKMYGDQLGKLGNMLKSFAQQLAEQQQAQQAQGPQQDPETQAKIQGMNLQAQTKAENTKTAHAQRTAQRQIAFELEQQRKNQQLQAEIERERVRTANDIHMTDAETASQIKLDHIREAAKPKKVDTGSTPD